MLVALAADGPARRGEQTTFRFTARNAGDASTTVPLVARFTARSLALEGPVGTGDGWVCAPDGGGLRCVHDGPVEAGASVPPLEYRGRTPPTAPASSSVGLVATFSGPSVGAVGSPSVTLPVVDASPIDLVLSATSPEPALRSGPRVYDVRVRNAGAVPTTEPVVVSFQPESQAVAARGLFWSCDVVAPRCVYTLPVLGGAEAPPLRVTATPGVGTIGGTTFGAVVSGGGDRDPTRGNDLASARSTTVPDSQVDLTVAMAGTNSAPVAGRATFTVRVRNAGLEDSSGPLKVTLARRNGGDARSIRATGDGWECPTGTATCTTSAPVAAGVLAQPLVVDAPATDGGTSSVVATVSGGRDANPSNNAAGASRSVQPAAPGLVDVALTDVRPHARGSSSAVLLEVSNPGAVGTTGPTEVRFTSDLPAVGTGDGWSCTGGGVCRREEGLEAGSSAPPITLAIDVGDAADLLPHELRASASSGPGDATRTVVAGASAGAPLTDVVLSIPELPPLVRGDDVSLPLRVHNVGRVPAPGPITVTLGAFSPVRTARGDGWICTSRTVRGLRCAHDGPIPATGALPDLVGQVDARPSPTPRFLGLEASVTGLPGFDVDLANNMAGASTGIGVPAVTLVPVFGAVRPSEGPDSGTAEVVVHNSGSRESSGDIVLAPTGWTGVGGDGWRCGRSCRYGRPVLPGGSTPPLTVEVATDGALEVALTGGGDDDPGRPRTTARVPVAPPRQAPHLELSGSAPKTRPGDEAAISFTLDARSATPVAEPIEVRLDPSPGVVLRDVTGAGLRCIGFRCRLDSGLPTGAPRYFVVHARVTSGVGGPAVVRMRASTVSPGPVGTAEATVRLTPLGSAGDVVTSITGPGPRLAGDVAEYRVTARNTGGATVRGPLAAELSTTVPPGATAATVGDGWVCEPDGLSCVHPGPVPSGASLPPLVTRTIVPRATGSGARTSFGANVRALSDDDTGGDNDRGSVTGPVSNADAPNLTLGLAATDPLPFRGTARFEARVRNTGTRRTTSPVEVSYAGKLGPDGRLVPSGPSWACPQDDDACTLRGALDPGEEAPPLTLTTPDGTFGFGAPETATVLLRNDFGTASDDTARAEAPRPAAPDAAGVHAAVALTGARPLADGEHAVVRATVRGAGTLSAADGARLTITAPGGRPSASGNGWSCSEDLVCTTGAAVNPGADLPPVEIVVRRQAGDPARAVPITAKVAVSGDSRPADDAAVATVGIGEGRPDLATRVVRTSQPRAGTPASTTVRVHNLGTTPSVGTTTLEVSAPVAPSLGGAGWACSGVRCTYDAAIPAGGTAPDVLATQTFPQDSALGIDGIRATVSTAGDAEAENDVASSATGVGVGDRPAPGRSTGLGVDALPAQSTPGSVVPIQLTVRGGRDDPGGRATATVELPEDLTYVATDLDETVPSLSGRRLTWSIDVPDGRRPAAMQFAVVVAPDARAGPRRLRATVQRDGLPGDEDESSFLVLPRDPSPDVPGGGSPPGTSSSAGPPPSTSPGGVPRAPEAQPGLDALLALLAALDADDRADAPAPGAAPTGPSFRLSSLRRPNLRTLVRSGWLVSARASAVRGVRIELTADAATARRLKVRTGTVLAAAETGARRAGRLRVRLRVPSVVRARVSRVSRVSGLLRSRATSSTGVTTASRRVALRR